MRLLELAVRYGIDMRCVVVGAAGRMGQMVSGSIADVRDLELVGLVDRTEPSQTYGAPYVTSLNDLADASADVVIDFSNAEAVPNTVAWCAAHGAHAVIGTTGVHDDVISEWGTRYPQLHAIIAANFALGAILLQRFAEQAAPYFDRVEVIEYHHDRKIDAPSGTALETARRIAEARAAAGQPNVVEPTERETLAHARGAEADGNIRVHAVRMPGMTAHEDVIFGGPGEGLTLRHDAYDRLSFRAGILLAIRKVSSIPGITRGIDSLL